MQCPCHAKDRGLLRCFAIQAHIDDIMADLKEEEDMLVEVPLQSGKTITATYFGFRNPNFITVEGIDQAGNQVAALLPQDNIQVTVTTVKKEAAKRKTIGFQSRETS